MCLKQHGLIQGNSCRCSAYCNMLQNKCFFLLFSILDYIFLCTMVYAFPSLGIKCPYLYFVEKNEKLNFRFEHFFWLGLNVVLILYKTSIVMRQKQGKLRKCWNSFRCQQNSLPYPQTRNRELGFGEILGEGGFEDTVGSAIWQLRTSDTVVQL